MRSTNSHLSLYRLSSQAGEVARARFRNDAFLRLEPYSPQIAKNARYLATELLDNSSIPRAGEILPVLLDQALQIDSTQARRLGGTWFMLYLYTMLADAQIDSGRSATPRDVMTAAALLDAGLKDLRKIVAGTRYESIADQAIRTAIGGQLRDHPTEAVRRTEQSAERDAIDKNAYLVSLAAAYAALDNSSAEVVEFVSKLSLALQYLDDVTDRCDDFNSGNFTYLLLKRPPLFQYRVELGADELLAKLTCSGSLEATFTKTIESLGQAMNSARSFPEGPFKHQLENYISLIIDEVASARKLAIEQQEGSKLLGVYSRQYSDLLGQRLHRIAFSS